MGIFLIVYYCHTRFLITLAITSSWIFVTGHRLPHCHVITSSGIRARLTVISVNTNIGNLHRHFLWAFRSCRHCWLLAHAINWFSTIIIITCQFITLSPLSLTPYAFFITLIGIACLCHAEFFFFYTLSSFTFSATPYFLSCAAIFPLRCLMLPHASYQLAWPPRLIGSFQHAAAFFHAIWAAVCHQHFRLAFRDAAYHCYHFHRHHILRAMHCLPTLTNTPSRHWLSAHWCSSTIIISLFTVIRSAVSIDTINTVTPMPRFLQ